jgi:DNA-binding CsgD family transcriptional regulator
MLVFGTQVHLITFVFILLELMMFSYQLIYYLSRPQDRQRLWYLILLALMLFYNIAGGLFPDSKLPLNITVQMMIAYGAGFLMASYFPFYFYKAFDLKSLRWHALYGVPLFLIAPYVIFFVIDYAIHGDLEKDLIYGMVVPFIYAIVLLYVMFRAIRRKHMTERNSGQYTKEITMYLAISPWASLTVFGVVEDSQVVEVLCTNSGVIFISFLFISKSVRHARQEYEQLMAYGMTGINANILERNTERFQLTKRQVEIVLLIRQGLTYKEIAEALFISEKTVSNHLQNVYEKTGAGNKMQLLHILTDVNAAS